MADIDLMPPPMPGEQTTKKKGFLRSFFVKEEERESAEDSPTQAARSISEDDVDLDDVKRRLGLDEEPPLDVTEPEALVNPMPSDLEPEAVRDTEAAPQEPMPLKPEEQTVEIDDWSSHDDAESSPADTSQWTESTGTKESTPAASAWNAEPAAAGQNDVVPEVEQVPAHHDAVDAHIESMDKHSEKARAVVEKAEEFKEPQDWHLQHKEVPQDKYFILKNGHKVKSLHDLTQALEFIDDTTLEHHMNEHRNDFANWIEHVIGDTALAGEARDAAGRDELLAVLKGHHKKAALTLTAEHKKREKKVKEFSDLDVKLDDLRARLKEKTRLLEEEKASSAKRIKRALDTEVKKQLDAANAALEKERDLVRKQQADAQRAFAEHEKLNERFTKQQEDLASKQSQLKADMQAFAEEKKAAKELLRDAGTVKRDLEKIKAHQKKIQEHLKQVTQKEKEISSTEETLRKREQQLAKDVTALSKKDEELKSALKAHDDREMKVKKLEAEAKKTHESAERRKKDALAQEKSSLAKVKAETKKLEAVRKRIEETLKKVIKNKQKTMYAKQLREELEAIVLKTRDEIVEERKEMENEGYETYMESKTDTQPIGQPDSHEEEDLRNIPSKVRDLGIYKRVEEARIALEHRDLEAAKDLYNQLRDEFQKEKSLKQPEKNALYMSIRELYDDIHLAMLEQ